MASTPSARAFLNTRAGSLHPALDMGTTQYDPVQDQFVSKSLQRSSAHDAAAQHTEHFLAVMSVVLENSSCKSALQGFDIRKAHDWIEVRYEAGLAAQDEYVAKAKGFRGLFPRIGRKIGEMNPAIEPIATTLPAGDYTSLVCGGIVLLFKAFARVHDVRVRVMDTLGEYPDLLDSVERLLKLYPDDERLEHKAISLYNALLICIEGMIVWFETRIWDRLKAFMQQGLYARDLDDKITHMRRCGSELREHADLCDKEKTKEICIAIENTADRLNDVITAVDDVGEEVRRTGDRSLAAIKDLGKLISAHKDDQAVLVKNTVLPLLSEMDREWEKKAEARAEIRAEARAKVAREEAQAQREKALLLEQQLRSALEVQVLSQDYVCQTLGVPPQDLSAVALAYTKFAKIRDSDGDITGTVMGSEKFRLWYSSATSQLMLVVPPSTTSKTSPASFTAAALLQGLSERDTSVTIAYFCGKDAASPDEEPVTRLLRSLLLQLLETHQFNLSDWTQVTSLHDHHDYLFYRDLRYLCSFFKYLVKSSPQRAVFCIIDNVRILERQTSPEYVDVLVEMLESLVQTCNQEDGVTFKVLLFTPLHRGRLSYRTLPSNTLRISEDAHATDITSKSLSRLLAVRSHSSEEVHEAPPAYAELP